MLRLLPVLLLTACQSVPPPLPEVKVVDNPKKDAYVERLENEAGEGAAALAVAKDRLTGAGVPLVGLTYDRLAGIKQPTKAMLDKYAKTLGDDKALKVEEEKAKKVDEETSNLYGMVEQMDAENRELKAQLEAAAKEHAWGELRAKFLTLSGIFAIAGAGLLVVSTFVAGKGRGAGLCMIALSVFFGGAPFVIRDVVEAWWFPYATASACLLAAVWGMWVYHASHREIKSRLTQPETA